MSDARGSKTAALTEVNRQILGVARGSVDEELEWEFFCECGRADCEEHVVLTLEGYIALHDSGQAVLAPGHRLSQPERAQQLRSDAEALRRQAEHQVRRAHANLRPAAPEPDEQG